MVRWYGGTVVRLSDKKSMSDICLLLYFSLILLAKMTQAELAERTQTTKSYISKIENGLITPSVGTFYRIFNALGMRIEVVKPIC